MVSGVSNSGKSFFVSKLIKNRRKLIAPPPEKIIYCARQISSVPEAIRSEVDFIQGLPNSEILENPSQERLLLVIDDLQESAFNSNDIVTAFQTSRHNNIAIIILTQNLFPRGKVNSRDITLNCSHFVLFYSPRDQSSIVPLGRQLTPRYPSLLPNIFFNHINKPYKYLLIDLATTTPEFLRFRSSIFEPSNEIYVREQDFQKMKYDEACRIETSKTWAFDLLFQEFE